MSAGARRALVTGLSGQDGSLLAELLLAGGYEVYGLIRPGTTDLGAAEAVRAEIMLIRGDLTDPGSLRAALDKARPDEVYHLAAPTFVPDSWRAPEATTQAIVGSTQVLLEAIRAQRPAARFLLASTSEIFGEPSECPQTEVTPPRPANPYAMAKLTAQRLVADARHGGGLYACSAILYNHESERRPERFVTRKVTRGAAAIKLGLAATLALGDLSAIRDWSYAGDIVEGCRRMLQQDEPADYILASGVGHSVAELVKLAFARVGLDPGPYVEVDPQLVRPQTGLPLIGDPARARRELGWHPKLDFEALVDRMVKADLRELSSARRR